MMGRLSRFAAALPMVTCLAMPAVAAETLPPGEAAALLQRMADASRRIAYDGVFTLQQGDQMQSVRIDNRPAGADKESRLVFLDGQLREVRCNKSDSVALVTDSRRVRIEKRPSSRHFPDLLPVNAASLASLYHVKTGDTVRVAGLECRQVELVPKDQYRWGYVLCAEKESQLPLRAAMVNAEGRPLMQYAFAELRLGSRASVPLPPLIADSGDDMREVESTAVHVRQLPPGFSRIAVLKRKLPRHPAEVEHWVFSDGLNHVSMFVEPAKRRSSSMKGESPRGMLNLLSRQVGNYRVTLVGDVPYAAVESIAMNVAEGPKP